MNFRTAGQDDKRLLLDLQASIRAGMDNPDLYFPLTEEEITASLADGFEVVARRRKYAGLDRLILLKELAD